MNCLIWARVSSREQREGYSIDAQLRVTREKAQREGWNVIREFVVAESAKRGAERLVFNDMLRWAKSNASKLKINFILAHKLDRACRNMRDAVRLQELEDSCAIKLAFVENHFGPGAAGALSFNVMAAVAQYYSDNLRTEVLKGIEEKVRQGWAAGLAAYGYQNAVGNKEEPIQVHPVNSVAVQRIFELYSGGRYTFKDVARIMKTEGYIYRANEPRFGRLALSYILKNKFYIGLVVFKGQTYMGKHRPIIDRHVFERCQEILNGKNRRTHPVNHYLAGGLFVCAHCGYSVTGERVTRRMKNGNTHVYHYYRCGNVEPAKDHPTVRWSQEQIEEAIYRDLLTLRIPGEETRAWVRGTLAARCADQTLMQDEERRNARRRLAQIEQMQKRLLEGYLSGALDQQTFTAKSGDLKLEAEELGQKSKVTKKPENPLGIRILEAFDCMQAIAEKWRVSSQDEKRHILDQIYLKRSLSDVSLEVTKRKPFDVFAEGPFSDKSRGDKI